MHVMQVAGAEVLVKQIIERLSDRIEPTVICLDDVGELGYQLNDAGVTVEVLGRKPGLDTRVARRMADVVRDHDIELLHAHQYTPFFYAALARGIYDAKARIVFTEHGRHFPDVVSRKRHWANRLWLQRHADVSTGCCDFSTRALRRIEGFPRAVTLRNGVDLSGLPPRGEESERRRLRESLGLDPDRRYAACVARFHPIKDHPTLIRAWRHVHEAVPDARLLLVGDGPERVACEILVAELGLSDSIEFWGIRHDVAAILRSIDVFTLTSISEAASLTLLEAMASECPAVVTDVGGNGEHVRDGEHGFLVPRGDAGAVGAKLTELLRDPAKASQMGKSARRRVVDEFRLAHTVEAYAKLYQQVCQRRVRD